MEMIQYYLKRLFHFIKTGLLQGLPAQLASNFVNQKLIISVITGTDGKTTTATLLYHFLKTNGIQTGLITTVAAYIGQEEADTGFHVTAPQPKELYQLMQKMVRAGCTHLVLEVTSHGIYQYRNWGITPSYAGLTNISREHFDYHLTYQEYVKAKLSLLKKAKVLYLNQDDQSYSAIRKLFPGIKHKTYSAEDQLPKLVLLAIKTRFPENYNQMNARLAVQLAQEQGVADQVIAKAIKSFPQIPGRMEAVASKPVRIIVDFAHTPNALRLALTALRKKIPKQTNLIAVFGCAGLRDQGKRPLMGKIGSELADLAVLTAEDPRTENIWSILLQMKDGIVSSHRKVLSIPDRKAAITFAINKLAKKGDTVAIFGKGHEQSMCYGTTETAWSDVSVVKELLAVKP
ncbi:MAG: hypothetical protein COY81_01195 [Candidatus Pacebacteria bacterium CG_4_10_14_0_8_um_filter_43_12]|nr:MAG: hypothetical protein COY81_01195 [Candidatus Pacebacteria bacterium CG_4_10_14_0_8_um_filter_43_12]